jgi:NAD(P)-dependent dehydrogenase (short-subunit alcohol dehydrogenase family)
MTKEPAPPLQGDYQRATYPDLAGKIAVVTGGSRGIGAAAARAFAANGTSVAVVGRDQTAIDATVESISADGGTAHGMAADCTVEGNLATLRQKVADDLGPVDILVVFAGGNGMPVPTDAETGEHWREVIETDLTSTFLTVSAFLPAMIARQSGVIIMMSSAAARQAAKSSGVFGSQVRRHRLQPSSGRRVRQRWNQGQLHRAVGHRERPHAVMGARRTAQTTGRGVPPRTARATPGRGLRHALSRFLRLIMDYRCHSRHRRRKDHAMSAAVEPTVGNNMAGKVRSLRINTLASLVMLVLEYGLGVWT